MRRALWILGLLATAGCHPDARSEKAPEGRLAPDAAPRSRESRESRASAPLGEWMKANAVPALGANDRVRLAGVFRHLEQAAPPGYADWASISSHGAASAASGDLEAARAACKACHTEHKARYRAEHD
jgi:hypothetical protein